MRIFIALDLPDEIKKELSRLQDLLPEFNGKKTELDNMHLTLKFLGEITPENLEQIKAKLKKIKLQRFKVHLGELGIFTPRFIKIIWIRLIGAERLQEEIDKQMNPLFKGETRFMSHITLARVKAVKERKDFLEKVSKLKAKWMEFPIEKFVLKESVLGKDKPAYQDLEIYELE